MCASPRAHIIMKHGGLRGRLSAVVLALTALNLAAEANRTHVWNMDWHPYARFHIVWQLGENLLIAAVVLWLLYWPGLQISMRLRLHLALVMSWIIPISYLAAAAAIPTYKGSLVAVPAYDIQVLGINIALLAFLTISAFMCRLTAGVVLGRG